MRFNLDNEWQLTGSHKRFWEFGRSMELKMELKGIMPWIPASVPGSVHWDLHQAGHLPDPYWHLNAQACEWVNERDWLYRTTFVPDNQWRGRRIRLVCEGIDYSAKIRLNGEPLGQHEGMFTPAVLDITDRIRWGEDNTLLIGVGATPDGMPQLGYTNQVTHLKSRFGYKWDFSPRLQNIGLWKPVWLSVNGSARLDDVRWETPALQPGDSSATACVTVRLNNEAGGSGTVRTRLYAADGTLVVEQIDEVTLRPGLQTIRQQLAVERFERWYPNGCGEQPLYKLRTEVYVGAPDERVEPSDERELTVGFRTLEFSPNPGAPADALAYTVVVNGQPLYLKGWNLVPVDQLYGRERKEQYERLVRLAKEANVNLLRVWGGGLIERELFYELCDQAGILIWQEMMQSSSGFNNEPSEDPTFLHELQMTMRHVVQEKRNHVSLAIWCGGNELTEGGHLQDKLTPLTDRHPNLRMLRDLVADLDPERLFLPASSSGPVFFLEEPYEGQGLSYDVHGPWKYAGHEGHYRLYNGSDALLHSEYGADGFASMASLRLFLPPEELVLAEEPSPSWLHHGYEYWNMNEQLKELFGPIASLEEQIALSRWLQAEAIGYAVEANRRRAPHCSGSILWQMNEPFPNISCTSAVDYYGEAKPAYYRVALAQRPNHPSARYAKLAFAPGETFEAELFVCADWPGEQQAQLGWTLASAAGEVVASGQTEMWTLAQVVASVGAVAWQLPDDWSEPLRLTLSLQLDGEEAAGNEYWFACAGVASPAPLASLRAIAGGAAAQ
jgi:beta-mannosidase